MKLNFTDQEKSLEEVMYAQKKSISLVSLMNIRIVVAGLNLNSRDARRAAQQVTPELTHRRVTSRTAARAIDQWCAAIEGSSEDLVKT